MLDPRQEARKIWQEHGEQKIPVDVNSIAKKLGAKVISREYEESDLCGMIYREDGITIIGINEKHPPTRQRFTIAHEIGHLVMHGELLGKVHVDEAFGVKLKRDGRSSLGQDQLEIEANKFAAELLIPTHQLKIDIKDAYFDAESGPVTLAKKYNVSTQAISIKLAELFPEGIF